MKTTVQGQMALTEWLARIDKASSWLEARPFIVAALHKFLSLQDARAGNAAVGHRTPAQPTKTSASSAPGVKTETLEESRGVEANTVPGQMVLGVDWERKYQALNTVHSVFATAIRKAVGIECEIPLTDIVDVVVATKRQSNEYWTAKYGKLVSSDPERAKSSDAPGVSSNKPESVPAHNEKEADTKRLDWLEGNFGRVNHYVNAGGGEDSGKLFWHAQMPDGFLSKDHGNSLREAIDAIMAATLSGEQEEEKKNPLRPGGQA